MPGSYQVEAEHPNMKFSTVNFKKHFKKLILLNFYFFKNKVNVIFSKENWFAKDPIVVSGFLIEVKLIFKFNFLSNFYLSKIFANKGFVTTLDKSPVKDAVVELFFADDSYSKVRYENKLRFKNKTLI